MNTTQENKTFALGIDVGSTTVKTVVIDTDTNRVVHTDYQRHFSKVRETVCERLAHIATLFPKARFRPAVTGSAGLGIANAAKLPFVQEVFAAYLAVGKRYDDIDCVIELGGEDAKLIFLTGGLEQRMNGSCAGGTGAFIDQMATLLGMTPTELDTLSRSHEKLYPIASRCGVFAKSDIQPLLNQGANRADVAASIFQAVVDQTVSGLAQGRRIEGRVLFLGGPLHFLGGLREAFVRTLGLDENSAIFPEDAPTFVAYGCAAYAEENSEPMLLSDIMERVSLARTETAMTGEPLFASQEEYDAFAKRHARFDVRFADIRHYEGDAYLGIDAGSTTTKIVLITPEGELLYQHYAANKGQPLDKIRDELMQMYAAASPGLRIRASGVTGYGEELIKAALGVDFGMVETVAHFTAARFFEPQVDFIIDIGGQDIKCFKIRGGAVDSIMLNEACSSGCGSFIQTFAQALDYEIADYAQLGLFAKNPVDLGSRCTVFMNSSVKQAQKDGATVQDISAGLSQSIIKNAIYKVIRAKSPEDLGEHIVVQGGTFLNDAVLRAFELELGRHVVRPAIAGLMGAFGAALYAMERAGEQSTLMDADALEAFTYQSKGGRCGACTANCRLTINTFGDGRRYISGNRCERPLGVRPADMLPNLFEQKYQLIKDTFANQKGGKRGRIGLPLVLGNYELSPFWVRLLGELGFTVVTNEESSRDLYYLGQHTIPSDTVCYPAKLVHGAVEDILRKDVDAIFYPCMTYNFKEGKTDNHYNCPVVAYYPELLKANMPTLTEDNFIAPHLDPNREKHMIKVLQAAFARFGVTKREVVAALSAAKAAQEAHRLHIIELGQNAIRTAREQVKTIIVLSGRPYHIDPEINHGIHKLMTSLGLVVVTEDCVAHLGEPGELDVLNQWTYHARLYRAAAYVATQPDMQFVQLVSFGCGIDAITTDEARDLLERKGKLYTQLKIDEINNLGAAKIRLRSLIAAVETDTPPDTKRSTSAPKREVAKTQREEVHA